MPPASSSFPPHCARRLTWERLKSYVLLLCSTEGSTRLIKRARSDLPPVQCARLVRFRIVWSFALCLAHHRRVVDLGFRHSGRGVHVRLDARRAEPRRSRDAPRVPECLAVVVRWLSPLLFFPPRSQELTILCVVFYSYDVYGIDAAQPDYSYPGNPAGLVRVDSILGTHIYTKAFGKGPVVFGAIPSLHAATAICCSLFVVRYSKGYRGLTFMWLYCL